MQTPPTLQTPNRPAPTVQAPTTAPQAQTVVTLNEIERLVRSFRLDELKNVMIKFEIHPRSGLKNVLLERTLDYMRQKPAAEWKSVYTLIEGCRRQNTPRHTSTVSWNQNQNGYSPYPVLNRGANQTPAPTPKPTQGFNFEKQFRQVDFTPQPFYTMEKKILGPMTYDCIIC